MATVSVRIGEMREAILEALREEMVRDPSVIIIGEDMAGGAGVPGLERKDAWGGVAGVTRGLVTQFGRERVLDTPISESGFIGASVGAALTGLRPVVELQFVDFMGVCLDQIFNQGGKIRYMHGGGDISVPIVIRSMIGAGVRAAAHQSSSYYSTFTHFPGLKVVVPSTPSDAKGLMTAAIRDNDPVIFFEHKMLYSLTGEIPEGEHVVPLGRADVKRHGDAVTVVAIARMVHMALDAADQLAAEGIEIEVVDPRTLSPLDLDTIIQSIKKTGRLVVVDEDNPRCSVAADIVASVSIRAFKDLKAPPRMVTAPHTPVPFSPVMEDFYIPSAQNIVDAVKATL